jgi:hypothetical protein
VALKVIKLGMDTGQFIARFEAERQVRTLMDQPWRNTVNPTSSSRTSEGT